MTHNKEDQDRICDDLDILNLNYVREFHQHTCIFGNQNLSSRLSYSRNSRRSREKTVDNNLISPRASPLEAHYVISPKTGSSIPVRSTSCRHFAVSGAVSIDEMINFLTASFFGSLYKDHFSCSFAGGIPKLRIIVVVQPTEPHLYHLESYTVDFFGRRLNKSSNVESRLFYDALYMCTRKEGFDTLYFKGSPSFFVIYMIDLAVTVRKYMARGYRFALIESGALMHRIDLLSGAFGFGVLNWNSFGENALSAALCLNPSAFLPVSSQLIGRPVF